MVARGRRICRGWFAAPGQPGRAARAARSLGDRLPRAMEPAACAASSSAAEVEPGRDANRDRAELRRPESTRPCRWTFPTAPVVWWVSASGGARTLADRRAPARAEFPAGGPAQTGSDSDGASSGRPRGLLVGRGSIIFGLEGGRPGAVGLAGIILIRRRGSWRGWVGRGLTRRVGSGRAR